MSWAVRLTQNRLSIDESIRGGQQVSGKWATWAGVNLLRPLSEGFWMSEQVLEGYYPPPPGVCHPTRAEEDGELPPTNTQPNAGVRCWNVYDRHLHVSSSSPSDPEEGGGSHCKSLGSFHICKFVSGQEKSESLDQTRQVWPLKRYNRCDSGLLNTHRCTGAGST